MRAMHSAAIAACGPDVMCLKSTSSDMIGSRIIITEPAVNRMTFRPAPILLTLVFSLAGVGAARVCTAQAEDGIPGFQSPSKNIACIYFEYDGHKALRCDLGDMADKPPRPPGCEQ